VAVPALVRGGLPLTTLLLNGDVVAYKFASAAEKPIHWGDTDEDIWTLHAFADEAKERMEEWIADVRAMHSHLVVALTDNASNFRKEILPTYKHQRIKTRKPILLPELRQHLRDTYKVYERPTLEGDDVLGILATSEKIIEGRKIVVSIDKDMKTIPGLHLNTDKRDEGVFEVTPAEADRFHMLQTLTGDTVDGYSGCPGIGPKRASQILALSENLGGSYWPDVVATYEKAGLSEAEALTQARVARILRVTDYDFKAKRPILWTPPTEQA
jgi:DNA polymerase-1